MSFSMKIGGGPKKKGGAPLKFGLTLMSSKGKKKTKKLVKSSLFSLEDETDNSIAAVNASLAATKSKKKSHLRDQAAALAQDASVFEYDSVYDDIADKRAQKETEKQQKKVERKSRYIAALLQKAESREQEQSIVMERQLLRERKEEDHFFKDKEVFVTTAYKEKLIADKKWEEEEARRAAREDRDVTKGGTMSDFYSNFLNGSMGDRSRAGTASEPATARFTPAVKREALDMGPAASAPPAAAGAEAGDQAKAEGTAKGESAKRKRDTEKDKKGNNEDNSDDSSDDSSSSDSSDGEEQASKTDSAAAKAASTASALAPVVERDLGRRNTTASVLSAKERYLQRKKLATAAAAKRQKTK